jgi:hypothetical protein
LRYNVKWWANRHETFTKISMYIRTLVAEFIQTIGRQSSEIDECINRLEIDARKKQTAQTFNSKELSFSRRNSQIWHFSRRRLNIANHML